MALVGRLGHEEFVPLTLSLFEIDLQAELLIKFMVVGFDVVELRRSDQLLTGGLDELIGFTGLGWENYKVSGRD